ncbi:3TM-type holin [Halomonas shengliensis]|uniref:3TM-type holin n=1 Tax=Halomonas shengliensis TaxID=419597 RepID=UPI000AC5CAC4|nr:3TM-type holin [Halomonas shengliensis]
MSWSDVAETVGKVAPVAGGALGGPAGAAVGGLIARALGVPESPQAVAQAVKTDPEAAVKLRRIDADLERTLLEGRTQVVTAEVQGESWLQRSWRPLLMLWFAALVGAHWLGLTPETLDAAVVERLLDIVQLGIGGYVVGRSVEKTARTLSGSGIFEHLQAKAKR